jgi:hypothetical protein
LNGLHLLVPSVLTDHLLCCREIIQPIFREAECNRDVFFSTGTADAAEPEVGKKLKAALRNVNLSEESLRNAIYTELKQHQNVEFPASASQGGSNMLLRSLGCHIFQNDERYLETSLESLLNEFCESQPQLQQEDKYQIKERLLKGLNVTTTSRPALTVVRGKTMIFGEVKNADSYSTENASRQCALYLCALLYFFRVHMGMPVESVFGFCLCGCRCRGLKGEYAVCRIRISAPAHLGASIVSHVFETQHDIDDMTGIQLLMNFLKSGKALEKNHELTTKQHALRRIPALLTLPVHLWKDDGLVLNGTTSIVFRGNQIEIERLSQAQK